MPRGCRYHPNRCARGPGPILRSEAFRDQFGRQPGVFRRDRGDGGSARAQVSASGLAFRRRLGKGCDIDCSGAVRLAILLFHVERVNSRNEVPSGWVGFEVDDGRLGWAVASSWVGVSAVSWELLMSHDRFVGESELTSASSRVMVPSR